MKKKLLEELGKLRDFNINILPNKDLADYFQSWIDEVQTEKINNPKLVLYIENQISYWGPKNRAYARWLEKLIYSSE